MAMETDYRSVASRTYCCDIAYSSKSAPSTPTPEYTENVKAWYRVWRSLTASQQAAWQRLKRAEKNATYAMSAQSFQAYMDTIEMLDFGDPLEAGHQYPGW